jgi:hypothetical protein
MILQRVYARSDDAGVSIVIEDYLAGTSLGNFNE